MVGESDPYYSLGSNALAVLCLDCHKPLYETKDDNGVTYTIAEHAAIDHSNAFKNPHRVLLFDKRTPPPCPDDILKLWEEGEI